ncbi:MAG: holo-ACP synthase [Spirochaetia bacterium]
MILGIGIDVVQVTRFESWKNNPKLLNRYFHPEELEAALSRGRGATQSLANRFAAKEALGKAVGIGLREVRLKDIQVKNDSFGKPVIILHERALEIFRQVGGKKIHCSLAHEKDNAIAMVVIEGDPY